jgi:hypothetical protein
MLWRVNSETTDCAVQWPAQNLGRIFKQWKGDRSPQKSSLSDFLTFCLRDKNVVFEIKRRKGKKPIANMY